MVKTNPWAWLWSFFALIIVSGCGSIGSPLQSTPKRSSTETPRRTVRLEYAASLQPYLDDKGFLVMPGQRLERWSGRTFIGSSSYDLVPID